MGSLCDRDKAKGRHSTGIMPLGIRSVRSSVDSYDLDSRLRGMTDGAEFSHGSRISRFQCVSSSAVQKRTGFLLLDQVEDKLRRNDRRADGHGATKGPWD
jgi:hypothetical protein